MCTTNQILNTNTTKIVTTTITEDVRRRGSSASRVPFAEIVNSSSPIETTLIPVKVKFEDVFPILLQSNISAFLYGYSVTNAYVSPQVRAVYEDASSSFKKRITQFFDGNTYEKMEVVILEFLAAQVPTSITNEFYGVSKRCNQLFVQFHSYVSSAMIREKCQLIPSPLGRIYEVVLKKGVPVQTLFNATCNGIIFGQIELGNRKISIFAFSLLYLDQANGYKEQDARQQLCKYVYERVKDQLSDTDILSGCQGKSLFDLLYTIKGNNRALYWLLSNIALDSDAVKHRFYAHLLQEMEMEEKGLLSKIVLFGQLELLTKFKTTFGKRFPLLVRRNFSLHEVTRALPKKYKPNVEKCLIILIENGLPITPQLILELHRREYTIASRTAIKMRACNCPVTGDILNTLFVSKNILRDIMPIRQLIDKSSKEPLRPILEAFFMSACEIEDEFSQKEYCKFFGIILSKLMIAGWDLRGVGMEKDHLQFCLEQVSPREKGSSYFDGVKNEIIQALIPAYQSDSNIVDRIINDPFSLQTEKENHLEVLLELNPHVRTQTYMPLSVVASLYNLSTLQKRIEQERKSETLTQRLLKILNIFRPKKELEGILKEHRDGKIQLTMHEVAIAMVGRQRLDSCSEECYIQFIQNCIDAGLDPMMKCIPNRDNSSWQLSDNGITALEILLLNESHFKKEGFYQEFLVLLLRAALKKYGSNFIEIPKTFKYSNIRFANLNLLLAKFNSEESLRLQLINGYLEILKYLVVLDCFSPELVSFDIRNIIYETSNSLPNIYKRNGTTLSYAQYSYVKHLKAYQSKLINEGNLNAALSVQKLAIELCFAMLGFYYKNNVKHYVKLALERIAELKPSAKDQPVNYVLLPGGITGDPGHSMLYSISISKVEADCTYFDVEIANTGDGIIMANKVHGRNLIYTNITYSNLKIVVPELMKMRMEKGSKYTVAEIYSYLQSTLRMGNVNNTLLGRMSKPQHLPICATKVVISWLHETFLRDCNLGNICYRDFKVLVTMRDSEKLSKIYAPIGPKAFKNIFQDDSDIQKQMDLLQHNIDKVILPKRQRKHAEAIKAKSESDKKEQAS